jgi:hypothetical protein
MSLRQIQIIIAVIVISIVLLIWGDPMTKSLDRLLFHLFQTHWEIMGGVGNTFSHHILNI